MFSLSIVKKLVNVIHYMFPKNNPVFLYNNKSIWKKLHKHENWNENKHKCK